MLIICTADNISLLKKLENKLLKENKGFAHLFCPDRLTHPKTTIALFKKALKNNENLIVCTFQGHILNSVGGMIRCGKMENTDVKIFVYTSDYSEDDSPKVYECYYDERGFLMKRFWGYFSPE